MLLLSVLTFVFIALKLESIDFCILCTSDISTLYPIINFPLYYYNFDLKEQKQIKLEDLLRPQQKATLEKLAHEAFKTWVTDSKLADNVADYEQAWPFKLSNNFLLGEQGLILQYGEYEIGPYVVGLPRLVIPYDQLQDVLKEEYLPHPKAKPASAPVAKSAG